jgi:hypothetical protein
MAKKIKWDGVDDTGKKMKGSIEIKDANEQSSEVEAYQGSDTSQSFTFESNGKILTITIAE